MKQLLCSSCRQRLTNDEVAFNLHLSGYRTSRFECLECLAATRNTTTALLQKRLAQCKENCDFFKHQYVSPPSITDDRSLL